MFKSKYPANWEPDIDFSGECVNIPQYEIPDSTVFLRSSLQGDFLESEKKEFKNISLRLPLELYADIEAVSKSGTLSRNAVIVSLLSSGIDLLGGHLSDKTNSKLNSLSRQILSELQEEFKESD